MQDVNLMAPTILVDGINLNNPNTLIVYTARYNMKQVKKYVAFFPSSDDGEEWWTADTLSSMVDVLKYEAQVSGTLYQSTVDGKYLFGDCRIFNMNIHPDVINSLR